MVSKQEREHRRNTAGRAALAARISGDPEWTQTKLAHALACSQPSVGAWLAGTARPDTHFRQAIERLFGIPMAAWLTAAEVAIATGAPASSSALPDADTDDPASAADDPAA